MSVQRAKISRNGRNGKPQIRRAAFYDLDGTLVDLNLVHITLFVLSNLGEWGNRLSYIAAFAARAPRLYIAEQQDRRLLNILMFEAFKGISKDRLVELGREYCDRILFDRLYPKGVELIEANRRAGLEPVLVTGSPDFVVAPLARRMGIDDFSANRMAFSRGLATGRLHEPIMATAEKATWCESYASERGMKLADCWGYADSQYDLPFLTALGHPVAVNPDKRLRATAMSRQWPIIHLEKEARNNLTDNVRRLVEA
jgi:HAD superfamily hydrolase (TIGR01490 family)